MSVLKGAETTQLRVPSDRAEAGIITIDSPKIEFEEFEPIVDSFMRPTAYSR